ncbi:MAG: GlsB/YeaQ/YmgE family stress response membrane protein [Blastocatellia bacterium]
MTLFSFLILLLIAGICGAIGQAIVGFRGGILVSIAVGFIGALIGIWLAGAMGLRETFAVNIGGQTFPIIWSIIGAALFVALIALFRRRRYI